MIQRVATLWCVLLFVGSGTAKVFVSFTFDDTLVEHADIAKTLESYNMKGVFFMNSGRIGTDRRYLTLPQVLAIQSGGHEIGSHTVTHANLTSLTDDLQYAEICGDAANFTKIGISTTDFAVPFGQYTNVTIALAKSCGFQSFRRSGGIGCPGCPASAQYNVCLGCPPGVTVPFTGTDSLFPLRSLSFRSYFLDLFLQTLEYARQRSAVRNTYLWLVFIFHDDYSADFGVSNTTVTNDQLMILLDWIRDHNNEVTTVTIRDVVATNEFNGTTAERNAQFDALFFANQIPNATVTASFQTTTSPTTVDLGGLGVGGVAGVAIGGFLVLGLIPLSAYVINKKRRTSMKIAENAAVEVASS